MEKMDGAPLVDGERDNTIKQSEAATTISDVRSLASKPGWSRLALGCFAALIVFSVFVIGAGVGFGFGRLSAAPGTGGVLTSAGLGGVGDTALRASLTEEFGTFWEAMDVIYSRYYGELPAGDDATFAAIRGVIDSLNDPNTSFYAPDEAEVFRTNLTGSFEGIGARVDWDMAADTVRVVEPFENQPAWKAGIRRDDLIVAIDGESVVGTDLTSAVAKIRGPEGSTALLTIVRADENDGEPFDVAVVRDRIETPTVSTETMGEGGEIAYVRLYTFNENAGALVKQAIKDAVRADAQGLILDLRGNTGGLLREAVKVSSLFLEDEVVLLERFKSGAEEVYYTEGSPVTLDLPLVVLVNEGSASASEIVAGALQDAQRATLVGTTTYGKGSVQLPETLDDGSIVRVTIARWYTPANRTIDGVGLTPDVESVLTDEEREAGDDPQLAAALEEVQGLIGIR